MLLNELWLERGVRNEIVIKGVVTLDVGMAAEARYFWYLCLVLDFCFGVT